MRDNRPRSTRGDIALGAFVLFMWFYGWRLLAWPIAWLMGVV